MLNCSFRRTLLTSYLKTFVVSLLSCLDCAGAGTARTTNHAAPIASTSCREACFPAPTRTNVLACRIMAKFTFLAKKRKALSLRETRGN
uniref:Putative secreted protein n=1 Tax=Ixodes ricinus TaxID=34613 RepID=A0A6B0UAJ8_IXORI